MKKILLISCLLFVSLVVYCQPSKFGLKGGVNYANVGGDAAGVESKIAFHVGVFCIIKSTDHFAFQPELVFSRQGAKAAADNSVKINYDYVNIPLMFSYYATKTFFVQAGPQFGVVVGGRITDGVDSQDVKDQMNSPDLAIGVGFGFDKPFYTLGLRYNAGLSSTTDGLGEDDKYPNQVLQLSVGLKF